MSQVKDKVTEHTETLWDMAVRLCGQADVVSSVSQPQERTLLVIGSKEVGKSTLIYKLLDRNETPKPTLALEYSFGRKASRSLAKDTCHIWELGGGSVFIGLLPQLLLAPLKSGRQASVVILLDLSAPHQLWTILESLLTGLTSSVQEFKKINPSAYKELKDAAWVRVGRDHPDAGSMDPFPVPLAILGGKYDKFKDMDPEHKKIVCRCLRSVALILGASLHFYSAKDASLVKKGKELMSHGGFGASAPKGISQDYNLPLAIPAGGDSLQQIGLSISSTSSVSTTLDKIKHIYTTHFPQEMIEMSIPDDPAQNPSFREPIIDSLRAQKDTELERLHTEIERRSKITICCGVICLAHLSGYEMSGADYCIALNVFVSVQNVMKPQQIFYQSAVLDCSKCVTLDRSGDCFSVGHTPDLRSGRMTVLITNLRVNIQ